MKHLTIAALIFMLLVSCGLQYVPAEAQAPEPAPAPAKPVVELIRTLPPIPANIVPMTKQQPEITIDPRDAEYIAKTLAGEYFGPDLVQQAAVCWCILNRCDARGMSVKEVVTEPGQFLGYRESNAIEPRLLEMAVDVLTRHEREKLGETDVGRVLPKDYMWFAANSDYTANIFRNAYKWPYDKWDWSLESPYD